MPHGLLGLIVAAVVAATMSTHSGAINSLAATTTHDIYLPITGRGADDPETLRAGKRFALAWGLALTFGALFFPEGRTPVVVIALSIASFTYGALLGGFFLGIFVRRARQRDALIGMSVGLVTMALIVFARLAIAAAPVLAPVLHPVESVAWPWYVLIGTLVTVGAGTLASFLPVRSSTPQRT
jgi:Na+/proline symporter